VAERLNFVYYSKISINQTSLQASQASRLFRPINPSKPASGAKSFKPAAKAFRLGLLAQ